MGMSPLSLSPIGMGAGVAGAVLGALNDKPTAAQKALNAQMQDFNNYVNSEAKTEGLDATTTFQNLMGPLQRIVQGGPSQAGWSQAQTNAYNSQAVQRGAAMARDLGAAAGTAASAEGGGNTPAMGGSGRAAVLDAQAKAEAATSAAVAQGTEQNYEEGRENFFNATGAETKLPGVFATSNEANKNGIESNTEAQRSQQALDTAKKSSSLLGVASKGLSSLGGSATQGAMAGIKNLPFPLPKSNGSLGNATSNADVNGDEAAEAAIG
jgi:hypothetical protein